MEHTPLEITYDHPSLSLPNEVLTHLVDHILEAEKFELAYLGIVLTNHETVLELNREYLQHDYVTDVLSFPFQSDDITKHTKQVEGEIYVDLDTAMERAPEFGASFEQEAYRYIAHGLLHLLGYNDATEAEKQTMHALEDRYLKATHIV